MGGNDATARPALTAIVAAALVLTITYVAAPVDWVRASILVVGGLAAAATIVLVTRRTRPRDPLASWLLATGIALRHERPGRRAASASRRRRTPTSPDCSPTPRWPAPSLAFQRDRIRHDRASLLDALVVTVAAAQAGWLALIEPLLRDDTATLAQLTVAGAYPLGDLLVLGVAGPPRRSP